MEGGRGHRGRRHGSQGVAGSGPTLGDTMSRGDGCSSGRTRRLGGARGRSGVLIWHRAVVESGRPRASAAVRGRARDRVGRGARAGDERRANQRTSEDRLEGSGLGTEPSRGVNGRAAHRGRRRGVCDGRRRSSRRSLRRIVPGRSRSTSRRTGAPPCSASEPDGSHHGAPGMATPRSSSAWAEPVGASMRLAASTRQSSTSSATSPARFIVGPAVIRWRSSCRVRRRSTSSRRARSASPSAPSMAGLAGPWAVMTSIPGCPPSLQGSCPAPRCMISRT